MNDSYRHDKIEKGGRSDFLLSRNVKFKSYHAHEIGIPIIAIISFSRQMSKMYFVFTFFVSFYSSAYIFFFLLINSIICGFKGTIVVKTKCWVFNPFVGA